MRNRMLLFVCVLALFFSTDGFAASAGGSAIGWENPLNLIVTSVTGEVAFSISVIAMVFAFGMLAFGGDLNSFGRTLIVIVLVISILVNITNAMQTLFGVGATFSGAGGAVLLVLLFVLVPSYGLAVLQRHGSVVLGNACRA